MKNTFKFLSNKRLGIALAVVGLAILIGVNVAKHAPAVPEFTAQQMAPLAALVNYHGHDCSYPYKAEHNGSQDNITLFCRNKNGEQHPYHLKYSGGTWLVSGE